MLRLLRGAKPTPRHLLAAAEPHKASDTTPPQFLWLPKQLSMWGNATFGDCVTAEEAFNKACNSPEIFIPQAKAIKWARKNYVLNGAGLWEVLNLMQTGGFDQDGVTYNDGPFKSVNWEDTPTLQNAISQGPVKLGVQADEFQSSTPTIGEVNGWIMTGLTGGNPEDHCTSLCGYGTFGFLASGLGATLPPDINPDDPAWAMFTWSTVGIIDPESLLAITGEAWLRNPGTVEKPDAAKVAA